MVDLGMLLVIDQLFWGCLCWNFEGLLPGRRLWSVCRDGFGGDVAAGNSVLGTCEPE